MTIKYNLPLFYDVILPNYIMPNALISELAIVNYLHSMNSTRDYQDNSFFEQNLNAGNDEYNPLTFLFDKSFGNFPNSTGGGGNLNAGMYTCFVNRNVNSLYIGKRTVDKYIYPITMSPHVDDFSGMTRQGSKLNGEYFWKHMSAQALEDAKNGRALIFLDLGQENYIETFQYEKLHYGIERSGIPKEQIVLAFNSFNAQELYETWFNSDQRKLKVINWPYVMANTSYYYSQIPEARIEHDKFFASKNSLRKNYFVFKIRRPRIYRQALLFKMCSDNLLELGDWSWLQEVTYNEPDLENIKTSYNFDIDTEKIKQLYQKLPHSLQDEQGSYSTISSWTDRQTLTYENAYFYICTETYMRGEYKSVTEKVCKPMVNFLPFLFVSFKGALAWLRYLGFKTFSPFIDESYDDEPDESMRVQMIYTEIKKLCTMSKEELHNWYWQMEDILLHNHNHLLEFYKNDTHGIKLLEYLHNRVN